MHGVSSELIVLFYWDKNTWYSLGPLAASLQANQIPYEVIKRNPTKDIEKYLNKGFSVIYGESSISMGLERLRDRLILIKREIDSDKFYIVVGGPQASGDPYQILNTGADFVVLGEGESTLPELIYQIVKTNNKEKLKKLPGIAFLDDQGQLVINALRSPINLDSFCPYSDNPVFPIHPPIELMRGCAFRCRFCQVGYMYGNPRFRSVKKIVRIVKHYYKYFNPIKKQVDIRFIAPNSLGYMEKKRGHPNYDALFELIRSLKKLNVRIFFGTFPSEVRPEYITDEILPLFDALTNKVVSVGFQSGSDRVLSNMKRAHNVADGIRAYDLLTSYGLTPLFDFLLGTPSETIKEQWETLDLIRNLGNKSRARLHYFMPLPGTPWSGMAPAPLDHNIQVEIGRLAREEIITGEFAKQINFGVEKNT